MKKLPLYLIIYAVLANQTIIAQNSESLFLPFPENGWRIFGHGVMDSKVDDIARDIAIDVDWDNAIWGIGAMFTRKQSIRESRSTLIRVEARTQYGSETKLYAGVATENDANLVSDRARAQALTDEWQTFEFPLSEMSEFKPDITSGRFDDRDWNRITIVKLLLVKPEEDGVGTDKVFIRNPVLFDSRTTGSEPSRVNQFSTRIPADTGVRTPVMVQEEKSPRITEKPGVIPLMNAKVNGGWASSAPGMVNLGTTQSGRNVFVEIKWSRTARAVTMSYDLKDPVSDPENWAISARVRTMESSKPRIGGGAVTIDHQNLKSPAGQSKSLLHLWKTVYFPIADMMPDGSSEEIQLSPSGGKPALESIQLFFTRPDRHPPDYQLIVIRDPELVHIDTRQPVPHDEFQGIEYSLELLSTLPDSVSLSGSYTLDLSKVVDGGVTSGTSDRGLIDVGLSLDLDAIAGWHRSTVFMEFLNFSGDNGNEETGDFQFYSNVDGDNFSILAELWLETYFLDDIIRAKVGKVDANSEFAYVDNGTEFVNSSMGFSPTIFPLPSYPDPAFSLNIFAYPDKQTYAGFGVYDGATQDRKPTGNHGIDSVFNDPADLFFIGEIGMNWSGAVGEELYGRLAVGIWHHTGTFDRFDGTRESGTTGFYAVYEQLLWKSRENAGDRVEKIDGFLQYGNADDAVSDISHHIGAGLVWHEPFIPAVEDALGIGATWVEFSDDNEAGFGENYECAFELFYRVRLFSHVSLKPDLQHIINPGGDSGLDDATVATMRLEFSF